MSDDDELRALRARAYGRDADIDGDPAALARLRAMEAEAAPIRVMPVRAIEPPRAVEPPPASASPGVEVVADALPEVPEHVEAPPLADDMGAEARHPSLSRLRALFSPRPSLPWLLLGAACVALAAFGAATISSAVQQVDARLVGEIAVDPDASWPEWFGEAGPDSALFEEFAGLTIVRGLEWLPTDDSDASCIVAIETTELLNDSGGFQIAGWACEAGSFPATLRFEVGSSQPQELRDRFGDGTGIEMIMRGDRIEVFADR